MSAKDDLRRATNEAEVIETDRVEFFKESYEVGDIYKIVCPDCKEEVSWAAGLWKPATCRCGREWDVTIRATGTMGYKPGKPFQVPDNFGIPASKVRARILELQAEMDTGAAEARANG